MKEIITDQQFFEMFPGAPYRSTDAGRVPNPELSKTAVDKFGALHSLAATQAQEAREAANYVYPVALPIPELEYEKPIIIQTPGLTIIEKRNIRSYDSATPAIQVWNGATVELRNCTVVSAGDLVKATGNATLYIHHNNFYGATPTNNEQYGRVLNMYHPKELVFENNFVYHTGGLLLDHTEPGSQPEVSIRFNAIWNTDKRRADNSTGDHRAAILFNTVLPAYGEIAWNYFINEMNLSHVEDNINLYNSGGTDGIPFDIHNNFIFGAYPFPLTADFYTGSGITIDGDPGTVQLNNMSQYVDIFDNQIISTCNACMNIAAGHDIHSFHNTYISAGMFPDGTVSQRFWGGCCIWDASNAGANFKNNTQRDNTIGYNRPGVNVPLPGRQDWVTVPNNPLSIQPDENTSLPNPITLETEKAEFAKWTAKVAKAGYTIGNFPATTEPPTEEPGSEEGLVFTCKVGEECFFRITPADEKSQPADYQKGSIEIDVSSAAAVFIFKTEEETKLRTLATGPGTLDITVTLKNVAGKQLTTTFRVTTATIDGLPDAVKIIITQIEK